MRAYPGKAAALGDVAGDHRRGNDLAAVRVVDRGDRQRDLDNAAVASATSGVVMLNALTSTHPLQDRLHLVL